MVVYLYSGQNFLIVANPFNRGLRWLNESSYAQIIFLKISEFSNWISKEV